MLTPLVAYVLPVLSVLQASEAGAEEGGTYWTAYIVGVGVLAVFVALVMAVLSIGRGRGSL